jgi:hypothetical protein
MTRPIVLSFGEALDLLNPYTRQTTHIGKQLAIVLTDPFPAFKYLMGGHIDAHILPVKPDIKGNPSKNSPNFV